MKRRLLAIYHFLTAFGFDPLRTINTLRGLPFFFRELREFRRQEAASDRSFDSRFLYPCSADRFQSSGLTRGHYFHQDLLVARRIFLNHPETHIDVGSRMDGLVAHVASFRPIKVIDIRPPDSLVPNVEFVQADMMGEIGDRLANSCDSLSCLHALEHFGLGRYGDPINYDGHLIGLRNLYKIILAGGKFYFSVPIGTQRVVFNAHRVFAVKYLLDQFKGNYRLDTLSFIDDKGDLHENHPVSDDLIGNNFGCEYGCGIFELTKL